MSQVYDIPPDMREKEKILGGVFTLSQVMWFAGGFVCCAAVTFLLYSFIGFAGIIFGLPFVGLGIMFAVRKKYEMPYFTYLIYKHKYNIKQKEYVNSGRHDYLEFSCIDIDKEGGAAG